MHLFHNPFCIGRSTWSVRSLAAKRLVGCHLVEYVIHCLSSGSFVLHQAIPSLSEPHPTTTASFPAYVVEKVVVGRQMGEMVGPYVTGEISVMIAMSLYYPTSFFSNSSVELGAGISWKKTVNWNEQLANVFESNPLWRVTRLTFLLNAWGSMLGFKTCIPSITSNRGMSHEDKLHRFKQNNEKFVRFQMIEFGGLTEPHNGLLLKCEVDRWESHRRTASHYWK